MFWIYLGVLAPTVFLHAYILFNESKLKQVVKGLNLLVLLFILLDITFSLMSWPGAGYLMLSAFTTWLIFHIALAVQAYRYKLDSWDKYLGLASGVTLLLNILPVFDLFFSWWDNLLGNG